LALPPVAKLRYAPPKAQLHLTNTTICLWLQLQITIETNLSSQMAIDTTGFIPGNACSAHRMMHKAIQIRQPSKLTLLFLLLAAACCEMMSQRDVEDFSFIGSMR
jgi:hypothetical protein